MTNFKLGGGEMSPGDIAAKDPQRTAYIVAETGQIITYA